MPLPSQHFSFATVTPWCSMSCCLSRSPGVTGVQPNLNCCIIELSSLCHLHCVWIVQGWKCDMKLLCQINKPSFIHRGFEEAQILPGNHCDWVMHVHSILWVIPTWSWPIYLTDWSRVLHTWKSTFIDSEDTIKSSHCIHALTHFSHWNCWKIFINSQAVC
jgi:hypothetical protein